MNKLDRKNIEDILSLTSLQEGMLFHYLKDPQSEYYYTQLSLDVYGAIDGDLFQKAWDFVIKNNAMLRTVFRWDGVEKPVQISLKEHKLQFEYHDLSGRVPHRKKSSLAGLKVKDRQTGFDLKDAAFRVTLCKTGKDKYVTIISNHHILYDGWSNGIILREFFNAYNELVKGNRLIKPPAKAKFKEFVKWIQTRDIKKQETFWTGYLKGFDTQTQLTVKRKSTNEPKRIGNYSTRVSRAIKNKSERFIGQYKITLAALLYSAWGILLQRYNNCDDVMFGTTVSGRSAEIKGIEDVVGLFINTLPLRVRAHSNERVVDLLYRVKEALEQREEYESTPLVNIKEYSELDNNEELFDMIVVIENYPLDRRVIQKNNKLLIHSFSITEVTNYDLCINTMVSDDIELNFDYDKNCFDRKTIENISNHFKRIVRDILENPGKKILEIEILHESEKYQLLNHFNNTNAEYPANKTIHELFERQVEKTADNIAVIGMEDMWDGKQCPGIFLTYSELNHRSNRLAHILKKRGLNPENIAAIMVERSIEMVVGIMAVLKAGGAYLPIEPFYPTERIEYILKDSAVKLLLAGESPDGKIKGKYEAIDLEDTNLYGKKIYKNDSNSPGPIDSFNSPAYVIYTSGSTGNPKGVLVGHSSVVNLLWSLDRLYPFTESDVYLLKTSYIFDVSVTELFGWFLGGGRLALAAPGVEKKPAEIMEAVGIAEVTHINFVPSMFGAFVDHLSYHNIGKLSRLKYIFLAGEALLPELVIKFRRLNLPIVLENLYGPTEAAVYASYYSLSSWAGTGCVPIGKPLPNVKLYILGKDRNLMPIGVPGELYLSGVGVSMGYLNQPELTAKRFNRSYRTYRTYIFYKTGDLARWLPDGNIEFLGRIDHQVKIRGFRVELGEIENRLLTHDKIKEAVVVVNTDKNEDGYLCVYIVSEKGITLPVSELQEYLSRNLPHYMIPAYFVPLEKIPLTPGGKVDRNAFPSPGIESPEEYSPPGDQLEERLVKIWAHILGIDQSRIGIGNNFFRSGGHSLKAMGLVNRIHKELSVEIPIAGLFKLPTVRSLAAYIRETGKTPYSAVSPAEEKEYYPLSSAQERLYILQQMELGSTAYNMPVVIPLSEEADMEKLEETFRRLINRHESFRTDFHLIRDEPVQKIHTQVGFKIARYNMSTGAAVDSFVRPFDLSRAPLLRVGLTKTAAGEHILLLDTHHIIMDGTSQNILKEEFGVLYSGKEPPPLKLQYKDFSGWQNNKKQEEAIKKQEAYWLGRFSYGDLPVLNLPTDYPRPLMQSFEGSTKDFDITGQDARTLKQLVGDTGATLYMVVLSVYTVLLFKLSGQEDIIVGTPIAARRHADLEHVIGMFANTLVMRNYPRPGKTFKELLSEVKEHTLEAFENQEYQFEDLVDNVSPRRDPGRNPIFDVMFNLLNQADNSGGSDRIPGIIEQNGLLDQYDHRRITAKFDLNLTAVEPGEGIHFTLEYCTRLFNARTVDRIIGYFKKIVSSLPGNPSPDLSDIEILSEDEKKKLLEISWGINESDDYDTGQTIHYLFEEQAAGTPDSIAAAGTAPDGRGDDRFSASVSYGELNRRAGQLARTLRRKGVKQDTVVAVMVERSIEMIIAILAIMKAGGAYLPIDTEYPGERKKYILEDSGANLLLINYDIKPAARFIPDRNEIIDVRNRAVYHGDHRNPEHINRKNGSDLVYVIYTSGSTGNPKGVMLEHRNLVNLIKYQYRYTNIDCSRILQFATISFDASFHEIFSALLGGGSLYLINRELRGNIPGLFCYIERNHIKTVFLPMSFLRVIFNEDSFIAIFPRSVTHIQTAGEQVIVGEKFRKFLRDRKVYLHNHYGPSEAHVVTTLTIDPAGDIPEIPSIGKPILNTSIYILDKRKHLVPEGVIGELYIGGIQVGRGYLKKEQLTSERFLNSPFIKGERIYRTGDLARWRFDGNIDFLGRTDHQVKVRGFRVEPEEIESCLLSHPGIKESIVLARTDSSGDKYLCAYIVSNRKLTVSELREYTAESLPDYMIPSYFVFLEKIPLTPNAKVDREALPPPQSDVDEKEEYAAPGNPIEEKLVELWAGVLNMEKDAIDVRRNFFELGGHSLRATILVSKIHKELNVRVPLSEIFKTPTVRGLAKYIKNAAKNKYSALEATEKKEYYCLSPAQKRLYLLHRMELESTAYNLSGAFTLVGEPDFERLRESLVKLIERHESLRTSFFMPGSQPVQVICNNMEFEIENHGGTAPTASIINDFIRPFDLSRAPLMRVGITKIDRQDHILMIDMHHIISDGVSLEILTKDFMAFYAGAQLPVPQLHYKDYSEWRQGTAVKGMLRRHQEYWLQELGGEIPLLNIPADYSRPSVQSFEGAQIAFEPGAAETGMLNQIARREGATLFMVLLSIYNILLSKLSGQEEIVVGTPVAGRGHTDLEGMIGMFVNTLAIRNYPAGDKTFSDFLKEIKEKTLKAFENQEYPFEELVEKMSVTRDASRNPLFDAAFALQNTGHRELEIPGLTLLPYEMENRTAKFDLNLMAVEKDDRLLFKMEYCTRLFKKETVQRFAAFFEKAISSIVKNPMEKIKKIEIISEKEKKQLLFEFSGPRKKYPGNKTFNLLFEEQTARTGDRVAVVSREQPGGNAITYSELYRRSDLLAGALQEKGVQPDTIVSIMVERSIEMIVGILGILKAGGAYLPIDPGYPEERVRFMLENSESRLLLISAFHGRGGIPMDFTGETIEIENAVSRDGGRAVKIVNGPGDLVYMIYTSGSTGNPKGVMVKIEGLMNMLHWYTGEFTTTAEENVLLIAPISFDLAQKNVFAPLQGGSRLTLAPPGLPDYLELSDLVEKEQVTIVNCTPSTFYPLVEFNADSGFLKLKSLRTVFLGGEPIQGEKLLPWVNHEVSNCEIFNNYGPTECTGTTTSYRIPVGAFGKQAIIPIGKPIYNVKVFILDKYRGVLPVGISGELYIGGISLSRGYYKNLPLTGEKFIHTPHLPEKALYRTGDMARWLPDGNIEFLGRIDSQVKIRGFRVELGEIESRLLHYPGIKEAVVIAPADEAADKYLCAYIVPLNDVGVTLSRSELQQYLAAALPDYMVPSYFVFLEKVPLTPSGKVNRGALPEPDGNAAGEYIAPGDLLEKKLAKIWADVLQMEASSIGVEDNFFQLGGHSLRAAVLLSKIHKILDVKVPLVEVFKTPTIRGLARHIKNTAKERYISIEPEETMEYYPLSSSQLRMYFLRELAGEDGIGYNQVKPLLLKGRVDKDRLEEAFKRLIARHDALRTGFVIIDGQPVQRIQEDVEFAIDEFTPAGAGGPGAPSIQMSIRDFIKPFDLSQPPLLRVGLIKTAGDEHVLIFDIHHIVSDGVTTSILIEEFMKLYSGEQLPALRLQYKDYTVWQQEMLKSELLEKQESYWLEVFKEAPPVLNLTTDFPRPSVQCFEGAHWAFDVGSLLIGKLETLAREHNATLYMVLLAAYTTLLYRYSGQEDIVVGSPTAARSHAELQNIPGVFINTLAMRNFPLGSKTFEQLVTEVKETAFKAYDNQDYPFEELVGRLDIKRDLGRNPLFETLFIMQNIDRKPMVLEGLKITSYPFDVPTSMFDISLNVTESPEGRLFNIEYCTRLFRRETVERFSRHFVVILEAVVTDTRQTLGRIDILSPREKERLTREFNDTESDYPGDKTIHELFEQQVEKTPHHIAVIGTAHGKWDAEVSLTYKELNNRANSMALTLKKRCIKRETIAAVMVERTLDIVVGILGILKAGGTYLPLDPAHPAERNAYMLEHSAARLLLTRRDMVEGITARCEVIDVFDEVPGGSETDNPDRAAAPTEPAYVIYTSGSTGKPKGVMIQHNSVVNFINAFSDIIPSNKNDRVLSLTTVTFDIFGLETFLPLTTGAEVVVGSREHQLSAAAAGRVIETKNITVFQATPSRLRLFVEDPEAATSLRSLKYLLVGGEPFPEPLLEKARTLTEGKIYNLYGPTETTIWSAVKDVGGRQVLNIGKPIANTRIDIINKSGLLQPEGVPGELCIAGDGLARGYLNQPELTANRFSRFNRSYKSYRTYISYKTGDLARWLPDGCIEFLGRMDHQVKIRGFRIELGEIENRLQTHDNVKEVVVTVRETGSGDKYLYAYIVPGFTGASESLNAAELREFLSRKLPDYMIPSYFVLLEEIPLTPSGKVDRKALPLDESLLVGTGVTYVPPETGIEKNIARIWREVLQREEQVGMEDNFFDMGGNSFKLIQLNKRLNEVLETAVPLMTLFRYPTIRSLMECLNNEQSQDTVTDGEIDESLSIMDEYINMWEPDLEEEK